jgi:hypothetical protein
MVYSQRLDLHRLLYRAATRRTALQRAVPRCSAAQRCRFDLQRLFRESYVEPNMDLAIFVVEVGRCLARARTHASIRARLLAPTRAPTRPQVHSDRDCHYELTESALELVTVRCAYPMPLPMPMPCHALPCPNPSPPRANRLYRPRRRRAPMNRAGAGPRPILHGLVVARMTAWMRAHARAPRAHPRCSGLLQWSSSTA